MQWGALDDLGFAANAQGGASQKPIQSSAMGMCGGQRGKHISRAAPGGHGVFGLLVEARAHNPRGSAQLGKSTLYLRKKLTIKSATVVIRDVM